MVRYLEREGFDVTYCTNIDTHANQQMLLTHKALLSVGHDEYWSLEMRNNIEFARDSGVSLGFFAANVGYWQIRLDPSLTDATKPYRTIVCYKYANAGETGGPRDPFYTDSDPSNDNKITVKWRDPILNRPEDALLGVMTDLDTGVLDGDITVANAAHWVFDGTQLQNGDHDALAGLLGYEVDRMFNHAPVNTVTLAHSPAGQSFSHVTIYDAPSGAIVFSTGSMQWNWGLDDYNAPTLRPKRLSAAAQQITRNVLNRMRQTASSAAATFVGTDDATRGDWKGAYGADGYRVVGDAKSYPAYAQVTNDDQEPVIWEPSTSDARALQKANSTTDRVAATLYTETNLTIDINLTDGEEHRVAAYVLDWDGNDIRSQRFDVLDAATGVVLDTRSVAAFSSGRYLVWRLRGHVKVRMTHTGVAGSNAVISGLFFG